jgi:hypothetical protein
MSRAGRPGGTAAEERTLRALVDTVLPQTGGLPPASAVGADRRVRDCLDLLQPGATRLLFLLVDMYTRGEVGFGAFPELPQDKRDRVLHALADEDDDDLRDAVDAVLVFALNGYLTEWNRYDPQTAELHRPHVWDRMGYHGPSLGHRLPSGADHE